MKALHQHVVRTPYDHILAKRHVFFPDFEAGQRAAFAALAPWIRELEYETLWDLGCGTGEIIKEVAKERPRRRHIGVDQSADSIRLAGKQAGELSNLEYRRGSLGSVCPGAADGLLCIGNTAVHFGAARLGTWLSSLSSKHQLPRFLIVDFIEDWDAVLERRNIFQVWTDELRKDGSHVIAGLGTVCLPRGRVLRYLVNIEQLPAEDTPTNSDFIVVPEFGDKVVAYTRIFEAAGYMQQDSVRYPHSYGAMKADLWVRQGGEGCAIQGEVV